MPRTELAHALEHSLQFQVQRSGIQSIFSEELSEGIFGLRETVAHQNYARRKRNEDAEKDITKQNTPLLVGFRSTYVFDRLSRDLRPAWPATVLRRRPPRSCVRLDGSSHIIAQFAGPLQGGLDTDEFQFAGGDLPGRFVVSLCCV